MNSIPPKITLWTYHTCPWAQRSQIALKELGLPYEEVIIDLDKPREEWYLKINPRGLVPSLHYNNGIIDETLTESAIIVQFLVDAHPSHLLPASNSSPTAPLFRARVNFFVDTYFSKVDPVWRSMVSENSAEVREAKSGELVRVTEKEIEPLLEGAKPFFGGKEEMTLAEVLISPFILHIYELTDNQVQPTSLPAKLDKLPNFSRWAKACRDQPSVRFNFDRDDRLQRLRAKLEKTKRSFPSVK